MRAKLVLAVPGDPPTPCGSRWSPRFPRPGRPAAGDLNLGAPHRDLLLGPLQLDQLIQPGLRGQHVGLLKSQRGGIAR